MITRLSFSLFCGALSAAAQSTPLALDDAIRVAWANDPTVAALELAPEIARAREEQAGISPNPEIDVRATVGLNGESEWELGAGLSQRLPRRERVELARSYARLGAETAALHLAEKRRAVAGEVRRRFYAALVQQARLETAAHTVDFQQQALNELARRHAAGEVSDAELALVRFELLRAQQARSLAEAEHTAALQRVRSRLRVAAAHTIALTGDLNTLLDRTLPPPDLMLDDVARPELALAAHAVREAEAAVALARAETHGEWTVGAGVDFERRANDATGRLENEPRVNVSASVPWTRRAANRGDIRERQATLRVAKAQLAALRDEIAAEFAASLEVVRTLQPVLARQREAIAETTALPDSLHVAAARGEVSVFQLAQLRQQHLAIESDFLDAAAHYAEALAEVETLAGLVPTTP